MILMQSAHLSDIRDVLSEFFARFARLILYVLEITRVGGKLCCVFKSLNPPPKKKDVEGGWIPPPSLPPSARLEGYLAKAGWGPGTKAAVSVLPSPPPVNLGDELRFTKIVPSLLKLDHKSKHFFKKEAKKKPYFLRPPGKKKKSPPSPQPKEGSEGKVGPGGGIRLILIHRFRQRRGSFGGQKRKPAKNSR